MGMLSDRMCGGDGFGEARKDGYAFGPYLAGKTKAQRKKVLKEHDGELSDEMKKERDD